MIAPNDPTLVAMVAMHEGFRAKPYKDTVGVLTVGYGRNLEHVGIRQDEARYMLENDLTVAMNDARFLFDDFAALSPNRQRVLVDMAFNLGRTRLAQEQIDRRFSGVEQTLREKVGDVARIVANNKADTDRRLDRIEERVWPGAGPL